MNGPILAYVRPHLCLGSHSPSTRTGRLHAFPTFHDFMKATSRQSFPPDQPLGVNNGSKSLDRSGDLNPTPLVLRTCSTPSIGALRPLGGDRPSLSNRHGLGALDNHKSLP